MATAFVAVHDTACMQDKLKKWKLKAKTSQEIPQRIQARMQQSQCGCGQLQSNKIIGGQA
jgi:hypothetical protein